MNDTPLIINAVRMLGRVLRLYPKEFRDAFAADMQLTFRDQCRVRYVKYGAAGVIGLWLITAINVTWEAIREHSDAAQTESRISAVALFTGGLLWLVLHLPIMNRLYEVWPLSGLVIPCVSLTAIFIGLVGLILQLSHRADLRGWIGISLSAGGMLILLGGYAFAWFGWMQTGIPTQVAVMVMGTGLFLLALSLMEQERVFRWPMLLYPISLSYFLQGLWLLGAHYVPTNLLYSIGFWVINIIIGIVIGVLWMVIGAVLWRGSRTEFGRIA